MFRTGDLKQPNDPGEITNEVTPIKVGDTLFLCTAHQRLFALDAATGKEKWHFDPQLNADPSFQHVTCRGVSYHEAKADNAPCRRRRRLSAPHYPAGERWSPVRGKRRQR